MKPFRFTPALIALVLAGMIAFTFETWLFSGAVPGLTANVVLLVTAILFLVQLRESYETRRVLIEQCHDRDRPRISFQLTSEMRNGESFFAVLNRGTRHVEARVVLKLTMSNGGMREESYGKGLHGGTQSWIIQFGEVKTGHF